MNKIFDDEAKNRLDGYQEGIAKIMAAINAEIQPYVKDSSLLYSIDFLSKCDDSPYYFCTYHDINDPFHKDCIFCHKPQHENK